jgi:hypothetical protein
LTRRRANLLFVPMALGLLSIAGQEVSVNRRTYGILAGLIGSAVGAWWMARQRARTITPEVSDRGTVIFHNTPTPTPLSDAGVI